MTAYSLRSECGSRRGFSNGRESVQSSSRAAFASGDLGVFPSARDKAHRLQSSQRSVERAVARKVTTITLIGELLRDEVAMKLINPMTGEIESSRTNVRLKLNKGSRLSAHNGHQYMHIYAHCQDTVSSPNRLGNGSNSLKRLE
jgi:hypothetical protein